MSYAFSGPRFRGENYLFKLQTDLDALRSETLGNSLRECRIKYVDMLCILFSFENLELEGAGDVIVADTPRLYSVVPIQDLLAASATVSNEIEEQRKLTLERKELIRDGVFIPMLRYEHSMQHTHSKISGGSIPDTGAPTYPMSSVDDIEHAMSQVTEGSSRIDV